VVPQSRRHVVVDGHQINQRQEGVPGTVNVMVRLTSSSEDTHSPLSQSPMADDPTGKILASLFIEPNADSSSPLLLNASGTNQTVLDMVVEPSSTSNSDRHVTLQHTFFDPNQALMVPYCATFDPNPPAPQPMAMKPCFDAKTPSPHESQTFAYTPETGVLRPMWFNGEDDGTTDEKDQDPSTPSSANVASVTNANDTDSTAKNSTSSANNTLAARDQGSTGTPPQNVTLVFNPYSPEVSSPKVDAVSDSTDNSTEATTTTVTITTSSMTTMTTTVTSMASAMDVTSSAVPTTSGSASSSMSVAEVGSSTAASSSESTSMTSSSQDTKSSSSNSPSDSPIPTSSAAKLDVQVVGPSTTTSATSPSSTTSFVSSSTSSTVDAEAIASSIAESASTSSTPETSSSISVTAASESMSSGTASAVPSSTSATDAVDSVDATDASAASSSSMTPVSTAPYEWMFKPQDGKQ
jgi:hypothetical protein